MNIKWVGAHPNNFSQGRNGFKPQAIVMHLAEGSIGSVDSWFNNPKAEGSTHYLVGKAGQIHQYVKETDTAYGNGIVEEYDPALTWVKGKDPNLVTISIEHEGAHTYKNGKIIEYYKLTEAQYGASLALVRDIALRYGIPFDRAHVVGHYQIQKYGRANCPGAGFDWERLMNDLQGFKPNPQGLKVGEQVLAYCQTNKLVAATNEQYQTDDDTKLKSSRTWVKDQAGVTYKVERFQESGDTWKIELWQFLR